MGAQKAGGEKKNGGEKKVECGVTTILLKADMHSKDCAEKVKECVKRQEGVERVVTCEGNTLIVEGNVDRTKIAERVNRMIMKGKRKINKEVLEKKQEDAAGAEKKQDDKEKSAGNNNNSDAKITKEKNKNKLKKVGQGDASRGSQERQGSDLMLKLDNLHADLREALKHLEQINQRSEVELPLKNERIQQLEGKIRAMRKKINQWIEVELPLKDEKIQQLEGEICAMRKKVKELVEKTFSLRMAILKERQSSEYENGVNSGWLHARAYSYWLGNSNDLGPNFPKSDFAKRVDVAAITKKLNRKGNE